MKLKIFRQGFKPTLAYLALIVFSIPIFLGFLWLVITTFSTRTEGLKSLGWTLNNWSFLWESPFGLKFQSIWTVTLNTFLLATVMTYEVCRKEGVSLRNSDTACLPECNSIDSNLFCITLDNEGPYYRTRTPSYRGFWF